MTAHDPAGQLAALGGEMEPGGDPGTSPAGRRGRRRLRTAVIPLAVVIAAGAVVLAATGAFGGGDGDPRSAAPTGPPATATVQKTTLTRTETVDGSLGYGAASPVQASAPGGAAADPGAADGKSPTARSTQSGGGAGVVTSLPAEGAVIKRGQAVYSVDEHRVPLLYGSVPLYRTLDVGAEGDDVRMLERNLSALGYDGFTVDDSYSSATATAVKEWQDDLGREQTGTVEPGEAVVAPGARRVADVQATVGGTPSGAILTWTGTERIITVDLDVADEDLVADGTKATVELPDGTEVDAVVSDVGTAATAAPSQGNGGGSGGGGGSSQDATLPVTLSVKDQHKLGRFQAAPVDVTFTAETHKDVLAVPITALVALREGGYAVETAGVGGVEYVPVELGMFASGMVEVSGAGVTDGMVVGVPK